MIGAQISHIMCMLPEEDPRKLVYVWVVENGAADSFINEESIVANANLYVLAYKPKVNEVNSTGYEVSSNFICKITSLMNVSTGS
jgi:hypothetical protein